MTSRHGPWYDGLSWREKLRTRIAWRGNSWDEALLDRWEGAPGWLFYYEGWGRIVCVFIGHSPTQDHCGIPDHDYCVICQKRMPGAAHP